jgi:membrane protein DedA with SNARE-associated domain
MLEYALVFALLAFIGFGLPVPEETVLLLAAYFGATGSKLSYLLLFAILGIAVSDTFAYVRGRYRWRIFNDFKEGKKFIANTGFFAVFMSRFFISARTVVPFMAGAMKMPRIPFHLASILSALITCSVIVVGGGWIYSSLAAVTASVNVLWFSFVAVVTGVLVMYATRSQLQFVKHS